MSKTKTTRGFHLSLPNYTMEHFLRPYAESRGKTVSDAIKHALALLQEQETLNVKRDEALAAGIKKHFLIPRGYTYRSFWITLVMLGSKYPKDKSRGFWGEIAYIGDPNLSNAEICKDILDYVKREEETA